MFIKNYRLLLFFILCCALNAKAIITTEVSAFYYTDKLSSTSSVSSSKANYDVAILMTAEGKNTFAIGWSYIGVSSSDEMTTQTTYKSTETGPKLSYLFGKEKNWYVGLVYNFTAKANFEDTNGSAEWRGTSYRAEFGFLPRISSKLAAGVKFNYHAANYNEQITNSSTLTKTTNSKTLIYPTLSLLYDF